MSFHLIAIMISLASLCVKGAEFSEFQFGQISHVNVSRGHYALVRYTFSPETSRITQRDERVRVQVGAAGRRGQRPTESRSVTVTATVADDVLEWTMPWRATTSHSGAFDFPSEWRQIITCGSIHSEQSQQPTLQSVQLTARADSPTPLTLQWRADVENVALGRRVAMKSLVSDISYKHFRWQPHVQEVRINAETTKGHCVCASLIVTAYCTESPYDINNHHLVVNFTISAAFTIEKDSLPGGFYLYLIPQWNDNYCESLPKQHRTNQHLSKTVEIITLPRAFHSENEEPVVFDEEQQSARTQLCK